MIWLSNYCCKIFAKNGGYNQGQESPLCLSPWKCGKNSYIWFFYLMFFHLEKWQWEEGTGETGGWKVKWKSKVRLRWMSLQNTWAMNRCPFMNYLWCRCCLNWHNLVGFYQELEWVIEGKKIISVRLFISLISSQSPAENASIWAIVSSLTILLSLVISMHVCDTYSLDSPDGQWREETDPS